MAKFVLIYHGGGGMPETEAEQAALYQAWSDWLGSAGDNLVDGGAPLGQRKMLTNGSVNDGGSDVTGYSIIEAGSIDEATTFAEGCPHLSAGGTVEVTEAIEM